jgi:hypothetical protein
MSSFWTDADERHKEIARTFYENVEYKYPGRVTSDGMCTCLAAGANYCCWARTKVTYPEYTGPDVKNI